MAKSVAQPTWQRALIVLTGTVVGLVVLNCLYWARTVFIPVTLAGFLTFLLSPVVMALHRRGVPRSVSVVSVVLAATLLLVGVVSLVTNEVASLAGELPEYSANILGKVRSLKQLGNGSSMERLGELIQDITGEWVKKTNAVSVGSPDPAEGSSSANLPVQSAVVLQPESPAWSQKISTFIGPVVESLGGLALSLVLVVFMLLRREDLRNRLIRLVGYGSMTVTTKAVDDACQRISRYLLMQFIINAGFGIVLGVGLLLFRLPHAMLWGFLAALMRYIPYVGTTITSVLLMTLCLAAYPGWYQPMLVLAFIVALELVTYNVLEPRLFSHSTGVSEVALLVAAALWAFLWGPVGLILSNPLTVCLVVLGKHVPQLEFLNVILGDEPPLEPDVTYYQRLLARDQDEATQLVLAQVKAAPAEQVYDALLVPALTYMKRDRERENLADTDEQFIQQATREVLEDLGERRSIALTAAAQSPSEKPPAPLTRRIKLLACPARDIGDRLALEMLRHILDEEQWEVEFTAPETLTSEVVVRVAAKRPDLICIGALPPGGLAHTRYLCKRLRSQFPEVKIIVGRWGLKGNLEANAEQLQEAGADQMATTLLETRKHLNAWLPILAASDQAPS